MFDSKPPVKVARTQRHTIAEYNTAPNLLSMTTTQYQSDKYNADANKDNIFTSQICSTLSETKKATQANYNKNNNNNKLTKTLMTESVISGAGNHTYWCLHPSHRVAEFWNLHLIDKCTFVTDNNLEYNDVKWQKCAPQSATLPMINEYPCQEEEEQCNNAHHVSEVRSTHGNHTKCHNTSRTATLYFVSELRPIVTLSPKQMHRNTQDNKFNHNNNYSKYHTVELLFSSVDGEVKSTDNCIQFNMFEKNGCNCQNAGYATSFTCQQRLLYHRVHSNVLNRNTGSHTELIQLLETVIGTSAGNLLVDFHFNGSHYTAALHYNSLIEHLRKINTTDNNNSKCITYNMLEEECQQETNTNKLTEANTQSSNWQLWKLMSSIVPFRNTKKRNNYTDSALQTNSVNSELHETNTEQFNEKSDGSHILEIRRKTDYGKNGTNEDNEEDKRAHMQLERTVDVSSIAFTHVQLSTKMVFCNSIDSCGGGGANTVNRLKSDYRYNHESTTMSINCHNERLIAVNNAGDVFCVHLALRAEHNDDDDDDDDDWRIESNAISSNELSRLRYSGHSSFETDNVNINHGKNDNINVVHRCSNNVCDLNRTPCQLILLNAGWFVNLCNTLNCNGRVICLAQNSKWVSFLFMTEEKVPHTRYERPTGTTHDTNSYHDKYDGKNNDRRKTSYIGREEQYRHHHQQEESAQAFFTLPSLWLITLDLQTGTMINKVALNTADDVVRAAAQACPLNIHLYIFENSAEVLLTINQFIIRINNAIGVRQPDTSVDTVILRGLTRCLWSVYVEDEHAIFTLDAELGTPIRTLDVTEDGHHLLTLKEERENVNDHCTSKHTLTRNEYDLDAERVKVNNDVNNDVNIDLELKSRGRRTMDNTLERNRSNCDDDDNDYNNLFVLCKEEMKACWIYYDVNIVNYLREHEEENKEDDEIEKEVANILLCTRADHRIGAIDHELLQISDKIANVDFTQDASSISTLCKNTSASTLSDNTIAPHTSFNAHWMRVNLNIDEWDDIAYLTRHITRQQRKHRQLLITILCNKSLMKEIHTTTIAELISTQEQLLCMIALRNLQNIGLHDSAMNAYDNINNNNNNVASNVENNYMTNKSYPNNNHDTSTINSHIHGSAHAMHAVHNSNFCQEQLEEREPVQENKLIITKLCQSIMRMCILQVAEKIRRKMHMHKRVMTMTASELVFARTQHILFLLDALNAYAHVISKNVMLTVENKFYVLYAIACIFTMILMTIMESRRYLSTRYSITPEVEMQTWMSLHSQECISLDNMLYQQCVLMSNVLANVNLILPDKTYNEDDKSNQCSIINTNDAYGEAEDKQASKKENELNEMIRIMPELSSLLLLPPSCTVSLRAQKEMLQTLVYMTHFLIEAKESELCTERKRTCNINTHNDNINSDRPGQTVSLFNGHDAKLNQKQKWMCYEEEEEQPHQQYQRERCQMKIQSDKDIENNYAARLLLSWFLRVPFVQTPFGYPAGAPLPVHQVAISSHVLQQCEQLALHFNVFPVCDIFALSAFVSDVDCAASEYARLRVYCSRKPEYLRHVMKYLLKNNREWELLNIHQIICPQDKYEDVCNREHLIDEQKSFLSANAPHLLWLIDPSRFESISLCPDRTNCVTTEQCNTKRLHEADNIHAYSRDSKSDTVKENKGNNTCSNCDNVLEHRKTMTSLARLGWLANNAMLCARYDNLNLITTVLHVQENLLSPECDNVHFEPHELIQHLLHKCTVNEFKNENDNTVFNRFNECEQIERMPVYDYKQTMSSLLPPQQLSQQQEYQEERRLCNNELLSAATQIASQMRDKEREAVLVQIMRVARSCDGETWLQQIREQHAVSEKDINDAFWLTMSIASVIRSLRSAIDSNELIRICASIFSEEEMRFIKACLISWESGRNCHGRSDAVHQVFEKNVLQE